MSGGFARSDLNVAISEAVMVARGRDLDPPIGDPVAIGARWTVSGRAHFDFLDLLLQESHRRTNLLP